MYYRYGDRCFRPKPAAVLYRGYHRYRGLSTVLTPSEAEVPAMSAKVSAMYYMTRWHIPSSMQQPSSAKPSDDFSSGWRLCQSET